VRKGFAAAVKAAGLPVSGPDKITPHVLRHTAATWAMQAGGDVWQIAGFLGMTVEMLQERYGHHHPDYQGDAARAVTAKPKNAPSANPKFTPAVSRQIGQNKR
jgi:integrase